MITTFLLMAAMCSTDACVEDADYIWNFNSRAACLGVAAVLNEDSKLGGQDDHAFCLRATNVNPEGEYP